MLSGTIWTFPANSLSMPHACRAACISLENARPLVHAITGLGPAEHAGNMLSDELLTISNCLQGRLLGVEGEMMPALAEEVIALSGGCDPTVAANQQRIITELRREEMKFGSTLEAGTGTACSLRHKSSGQAHPEAPLPVTAADKAFITAHERALCLLLPSL